MFTGFTPETVDFLWGVRMNNNRDWFSEHKKQYTSTLYEPMKALGKELFEPFLEKSGNIVKVSRIYRDMRMHPPEPYKDSLWICIRQDVEWWGENPCLYFEINPEGVDYGFFIWKPRTATMEAAMISESDRLGQRLFPTAVTDNLRPKPSATRSKTASATAAERRTGGSQAADPCP